MTAYLTLKALVTTAADDIHKCFFHCYSETTLINIFFQFFSEKVRLDVSSESSTRQRINMKNEASFSSKDKSKKLKCRLLQLLFGAFFRVKT